MSLCWRWWRPPLLRRAGRREPAAAAGTALLAGEPLLAQPVHPALRGVPGDAVVRGERGDAVELLVRRRQVVGHPPVRPHVAARRLLGGTACGCTGPLGLPPLDAGGALAPARGAATD